ncbi:Glutathione transporter 1 [Grifola frondosa]|uniref:Glutathione transporter 1 n=1 Tax=Grifola frondosa TaxID=5627 RepID=A0A1C7MT67_GRIFR|nr:Glutathione transporter 1 [Grifola frondosa]
MESKIPVSVHLPTLLRHRSTVPDVPEDVDYVMQHLNDPNWDLDPPSPSVSTTSFETDVKRETGFSSTQSIRDSDLDTESQVDSTRRPESSRLDLREADIEEFNDESPYAEVRASVSNKDDPSMPVNTFRTWFLGIIIAIALSGINHFFGSRYPSVFISALVAQLIALPLGKAMEWLLPTTRFNTFGYVWSFNPGPFNVKEHTVITAMANTVYIDPYATTIFATQRAFYNENPSVGYQLLLTLSTQLIGYSFVGLARKFLVWPASMIWPSALVNCALLNTLHYNYGRKDKRHMSRERFFLYVMIGGALWYFVPGFLFTGLSIFNWVCWIAPENQVVNTLFGYSTGLGLGFVTFDWSMISWIGSPLVTPWWTEANIFAGFVIIYWFVAPIMYFKNTFFSKFMPVSSAGAYDNTQLSYNISAVITDGVFDDEKYKAYSPIYLSTTFLLAYGTQFAALTAVVVHTFLWYRHDIMRQLRRTLKDERDVHARLMLSYPEVPHWWYAMVGIVAFVLGVVAVEIYPTQFPIWALVLSIVLAFFFMIPVGMLRAITNQILALNIFSEIIAGYVLPGRPIANMVFKTYGYVTMYQGLFFLNDLKVGHYMKIPPRIIFAARIIATILGSFVCVGVQQWMFAHVEDFCQPDQKDGFVCLDTTTFATSSIIWGGIGPRRLFSPGAMYNPILWFFLLGAILPIPFYFLARRYPLSYFRYVNFPVFFAGLGSMPPATGINYSSWAMVGAFFQWFMRRFHFRWWMRYNYILSAALDTGVAVGLILVFFFLQYIKGGVTLNWWGNTVWVNTFDSNGTPFYTVAENQTFGLLPGTWS